MGLGESDGEMEEVEGGMRRRVCERENGHRSASDKVEVQVEVCRGAVQRTIVELYHHVERTIQCVLTVKHSQYFFKHALLLQWHPLLCPIVFEF